MQYAYKLEYDEKPNYGLLIHLVVKILLDKDKVPSNLFDWHLIKVFPLCMIDLSYSKSKLTKVSIRNNFFMTPNSTTSRSSHLVI
jgi:hypothetical protein